MLNNEERELCIEVAKVLRTNMNDKICENDLMAAMHLGDTLDQFLKFVVKLESKKDED